MPNPAAAAAFALPAYILMGLMLLALLAFLVWGFSPGLGTQVSWRDAVLIPMAGMGLMFMVLWALAVTGALALLAIAWAVLTFLEWPVPAIFGRALSWKLVTPIALFPLELLLILMLYYE